MEENQFIFTQQMEEVTKLRKMQQDNSSLIFCCSLCFSNIPIHMAYVHFTHCLPQVIYQ